MFFESSLLAGIDIGAVFLREKLSRGLSPFKTCTLILFLESGTSDAEEEAVEYVLRRLSALGNTVYSFPKKELQAELNWFWENEAGGASQFSHLATLRGLPERVSRFKPQVRSFVNRLLTREK